MFFRICVQVATLLYIINERNILVCVATLVLFVVLFENVTVATNNVATDNELEWDINNNNYCMLQQIMNGGGLQHDRGTTITVRVARGY